MGERNFGPSALLVRGLVIVASGFLSIANAAEGEAPSTPPPAESAISPVMMKAIRAATFEVVLKKPETDPVKYEKPLPLDQLPFSVRNDKYESIGTAFAIAPGRFVTAGHVTSVASGSIWGVPALRDAQGKVYPIDKVLKFSLHEDFIVFTATGAPAVTPLPTSTTYEFDTAVHAVGNALGQGIITRDGTLTSETPEDQDGRWKWLRFSAPASPGNSGGPLLDAKGNVIGLISRKSPNENLNFALPIAHVLEAPDKATMDVRYTIALPFLSQHKQQTLKDSFNLPLSFVEFDRKLLSALNEDGQKGEQQLLKDTAADLFPLGKTAKVFADPFLGSRPAFITQQSDGSWDVVRGNGNSTPLGGDGFIWGNGEAGGAVFHVHYPSELDVQKSRGDSQLLAEQVLKGLPLSRTIGNEHVRVTSIGSAGKPEEFRDAHGRLWQLWRYQLLYSDSTLLVMALPVPDGYVGYVRTTGFAALDRVGTEVKLMADYLQTPYTGPLPRWRAFLAEKRLLPESFTQWKAALDPTGEVSLALPRVSIAVDRSVFALTDQSTLTVVPGMLREGDRFAWDAVAVQFNLEPTSSAAFVVVRRPHPADDAVEVVTRRWNNMATGGGRYTGKPQRDPNTFYVARVATADGVISADAKFLYDVGYITPTIKVPGEVPRAGERLAQMVTVREK